MLPGAELADPEHRGLRVRCPKVGRAVFFYRYKSAAGALRQIEVGVLGDMTLVEVRAKWERLRDKVRNGGDPQADAREVSEKAVVERKAKKARAYTVADAVADYLTEMVEPNRKEKGASEARRMLERATAKVGATAAADFSVRHAHELVMKLSKTPRLASMVRQELRACWEHAIAVERIRGANPFAGRTVGGKLQAKKRERTLSAAETGALLRWMAEPSTYSRTVRDALELVLRTGLRSGEVCGIHSSELQQRDGVLWLEIPGDRMKAGKPHAVPLVGRAAGIVAERLPQGGGYLFPSRVKDKPIKQKVVGVEVYACSGQSTAAAYARRRVCPVGDWAPHDLRRTARTLLADLECPFEVGEAILAHALPGVAAVYNRSDYRVAKIEWLMSLGRKLDALAADRPTLALVAAA